MAIPPVKKSQSLPQVQTVQGQVEGQAQLMVQNMFQFLEGRRREQGDLFAALLLQAFLANTVEVTVLNTLQSIPSEAPDAYQRAMKGFQDIKHVVQEAVALGFGKSLTAFTGRPVEYYCQVKPVPEVTSSTKH